MSANSIPTVPVQKGSFPLLFPEENVSTEEGIKNTLESHKIENVWFLKIPENLLKKKELVQTAFDALKCKSFQIDQPQDLLNFFVSKFPKKYSKQTEKATLDLEYFLIVLVYENYQNTLYSFYERFENFLHRALDSQRENLAKDFIDILSETEKNNFFSFNCHTYVVLNFLKTQKATYIDDPEALLAKIATEPNRVDDPEKTLKLLASMNVNLNRLFELQPKRASGTDKSYLVTACELAWISLQFPVVKIFAFLKGALVTRERESLQKVKLKDYNIVLSQTSCEKLETFQTFLKTDCLKDTLEESKSFPFIILWMQKHGFIPCKEAKALEPPDKSFFSSEEKILIGAVACVLITGLIFFTVIFFRRRKAK